MNIKVCGITEMKQLQQLDGLDIYTQIQLFKGAPSGVHFPQGGYTFGTPLSSFFHRLFSRLLITFCLRDP